MALNELQRHCGCKRLRLCSPYCLRLSLHAYSSAVGVAAVSTKHTISVSGFCGRHTSCFAARCITANRPALLTQRPNFRRRIFETRDEHSSGFGPDQFLSCTRDDVLSRVGRDVSQPHRRALMNRPMYTSRLRQPFARLRWLSPPLTTHSIFTTSKIDSEEAMLSVANRQTRQPSDCIAGVVPTFESRNYAVLNEQNEYHVAQTNAYTTDNNEKITLYYSLNHHYH